MTNERGGLESKESQNTSFGFGSFLILALGLFIVFKCHMWTEVPRPYVLAQGIPTIATLQDAFANTEGHSRQTYFLLGYSSRDRRRWTVTVPVGTSKTNQTGLKVPIHYLEK